MKKIWFLIMMAALLLTGCGAEAPESPARLEPYALEIEYGDSGVEAELGSVSLQSSSQSLETEVELPFDHLTEVPFVNQAAKKDVKLAFEREPDRLEIRFWSSEDGYREAAAVEKPKTKLTMPEDGASYLYEITAAWEESKKADRWGSCTYYFRYLPQNASGNQAHEMLLYRLVQLETSDLFGAEMTNLLDQEGKTCRSEADLSAILDYLKTYLSTNFHEVEPQGEADYTVRLAATDGTQYVFSYGGEGKNAWITVEDKTYEAGVMDLYSLWQSLEAESVPLNEDWKNQYLQVCETLPSENWGEEIVYGNVTELGAEVLFNEFVSVEDEESEDGQQLKRGTLGKTLPVAENCEFWILRDHVGPFCQVPAEQLFRWAENADHDVLFAMYVKEGQIIAISELAQP